MSFWEVGFFMSDNLFYIVAGDEMQKMMNLKFPDREIIPFREDFSKGEYFGFDLNSQFINDRAEFWNVSIDEYTKKFLPIMNLDISNEYILCFGECECCKANLKFMLGYLKHKGYTHSIKIQILNEYTLELMKEYYEV